ncbi:MAG: HEAT repeat domain-containing protein [Kaiparowitsia implicata GSE-PSE-MK54-09C]|jgi:phycocyanobilin lyase beta subunit|nr:HEAT repeat domain-containing protein [Kaiparowitsia implicata GSE-PSE-MK54-09C]
MVSSSSSISTLITAVDQADSPERLIAAVQALAAAQSPEGLPKLIEALGYNNPGVAVTAVQGLVQMGDAAVMPLLTLLDDYNYGARAYAIRALAAIADPRALDILVSAAETDFAPSVRRAATKGVGMLQWTHLSESESQSAQQRAVQTLQTVLKDDDWSLRYAAVVGLQALATSAPAIAPHIYAHLGHAAEQEADIGVAARITWALSPPESAS